MCGSLHHPAPAQLSGDAPSEAELEEAKAKWETALRKMQDASEIAGARRAALDEKGKYLLQAMADDMDSPSLDTAREQLAACQSEVAEELARLYQALLEMEAQLAHRGELEQESARQEKSLTQLEGQAELWSEAIKQSEVSQGALSGQRA